MVILRKKVAGLNQAALARFVARARRAAGLHGTANVLVTTNRELRALNRRFRGVDKPTDVLSFPPIADLAGDFGGDVAISAEMAAVNGRQLGHSAAAEVRILVLHGVLHLAGHDHERDDGEMAGEEERLRRKLGLPVGLIERSGRPGAKTQEADDRRGRREGKRSRRKGGGARATPALGRRER
jgi:probable rRNA maturation factor